GWADTGLAHGDAADLGDLLRDLGPRQHSADARLRALGQFERDHLDLRVLGLLGEHLGVEPAFGGAGAEVRGAELPDEVAAVFAVVGRDRALTGVMGDPAHRRALVQGADGVVAQRAEAHRRDVEQRDVIGLSAFVSADAHTRWPGRVRDRPV